MAADVVAVVSIPNYFLWLLGYYSLHSPKNVAEVSPLTLEEIVTSSSCPGRLKIA